jgi:hypothetical protein
MFETRRIEALVDLLTNTAEITTEYGIEDEMAALLIKAAEDTSLSSEDRFWAEDLVNPSEEVPKGRAIIGRVSNGTWTAIWSSITAMRFLPVTAILIAMLAAAPSVYGAGRLKGVYAGSGGVSQEVHRVVMVEFGEDGSALVQQNWVGKDPQLWHARWSQDGKQIKIVFEAQKDQPVLDPLLLKMKGSTLTPTEWDVKALGVLGPPKLTPFGGSNIKQQSVATCQSMNSRDPSQNCVTWDSRK